MGAKAGLRPDLLSLALLVAAVAGFGIAAYLTAVHYQQVPLACTTNSYLNCAQVTQSSYSVVPGTSVPISVAGMAWFLISGALATISLNIGRAASVELKLRLAQLGWSLAGLLVVLYLIYVELVLLHRICEWCSGLHLLVLASFLIAMRRLQRAEFEPANPAEA